ncbi:MAG: hypothetical protein ACOY3Y_07510 [Acidobacteriota bacterium]
MRVAGYRPANAFLNRPLDSRWRQWFTRCAIGALVVSVTLGALVGSRQEEVRLRYEIAHLRQDVAALEREARLLQLERETLASPVALSRQLDALDLAEVPRERVAYLTGDGRLMPAPVPTPPTAEQRAAAPRGAR